MGNRVQEVNKALRFQGKAERLYKGRGYYYFSGGDSSLWFSSMVCVYRADSLSVAEWLEEYRNLSENRV